VDANTKEVLLALIAALGSFAGGFLIYLRSKRNSDRH
jgi:hypothetical protein